MSSIVKKMSFVIMFFFLAETSLPQIKSDYVSPVRPFVNQNIKSKSSSEKFVFLAGAGLGIHVGYENPYNEKQYKNGLALNLGIIPYSDGYRAIRIDAGFLKLTAKDKTNRGIIYRYNGDTVESTTLKTGGDLTMCNLRLDIIAGYLKQKSFFNAYGYFALGAGNYHVSGVTYTDVVSNKNTSFSSTSISTSESHDEIYGKMGLGAGMSIKLSGKFRVYTEIQYDFWSFGWSLGEGEVISRAGVMFAPF